MNVVETVKSILSKRVKKVDIDKLKETDSLKELGLDSLDLVELMLEIEDAFNIEFSSEEIEKLETLKEVLELINKKIS